MEKTESREHAIYRITIIGFFVNLLLTAAKFAAGILGRSGAMIADAVHSLSDFATDVVVLAFVKVSSKPKDECHDYGHGKYETLATVLIGVALFGVAIGILVNSIKSIANVVDGNEIQKPGLIALIAAAVSIISKEILYQYTARVGKRVNSPAVIANAWHHRSDALSSIGTLIGIGGAHFLGVKWRILDPIAAIIVALLIMKVAYDLILPGINELLERSLPKDVEDRIVEIIKSCDGAQDPHNLRTRRIGPNYAIDVHVRFDGQMTVAQSHKNTVDIERRLRAEFGDGTIVVIHVEPVKPY